MSSPHDLFLENIHEEVNSWSVLEFLDYAEKHKDAMKLNEEWKIHVNYLYNKTTSLHALIVQHLAEERGI